MMVSQVPPGMNYEAPFMHIAEEYVKHYLESVAKLEADSASVVS